MPGEFRKTEFIDGSVVTTFVVDDAHDGWRADRFLGGCYRCFSRNRLQSMIDDGRIVMREKRLKASTRLKPGDQVLVITDRTEEPAVDLDYGVLYEDEHLLVVDKPGNLPVHPAGKFLFNTLLMALRRERADWLAAGHDFYLIHRIDRETSGVLVIGKTHEAAGWLVRQFRERRIDKRYYAVVAGASPTKQFTVDYDLGSDTNSKVRLKMAAFPKGKGEMDALTRFTRLRANGRGPDRRELLDCELFTGRQHQIRVHLAASGLPIVGDKLYGGDERVFLDHIKKRGQAALAPTGPAPIARHALHSRYIKFFHEPLERWMAIESPLPGDMGRLLSA